MATTSNNSFSRSEISPAFSDITTIKVGGVINDYHAIDTVQGLVNQIESQISKDKDFLIIGGGSNILPQDGDYFKKTVIHLVPSRTYETVNGDFPEFIWAGERLDNVVHTLKLSPLSGIPGTLGGAIVQNAGAYGYEISDFIEKVRVLDIDTFNILELSPGECGFSYRSSIFKSQRGDSKYIVLGAKINASSDSIIVNHAQLAKSLGVELGRQVSSSFVRSSVLELRKSKGMLDEVLDSESVPSCGSFFKNPIITLSAVSSLPDGLPDEAPKYMTGNSETVKVSAAWLIQNSGLNKGFTLSDQSRASLSTKHVLSLVNSSENISSEAELTAGADLRELMNFVIQKVSDRWDITLEPEVIVL